MADQVKERSSEKKQKKSSKYLCPENNDYSDDAEIDENRLKRDLQMDDFLSNDNVHFFHRDASPYTKALKVEDYKRKRVMRLIK